MEPLYLVIASASGLALGYVAATSMASSARAQLAAKLEDETSALREAENTIKSLKEAESKSGKANSSSKGGKSNKKKSNSDKGGSGKDTKKLEKQVADANREVERLKDAQMAAEKQHSDAIAKIEAKLASAEEDKTKALEEAKAEAASALEAAVAKAASEAAPAAPAAEPAGDAPGVNPDLTKALESAGTSLDDILAALVSVEGQTGVLLGDANGIIVAKAGDADTVENTAAASNTLVSIPQRLGGMLPLDKYFAFSLEDGENAIAGCAFESEGDVLALTAVGPTAPNQAALKAVVDRINAALA